MKKIFSMFSSVSPPIVNLTFVRIRPPLRNQQRNDLLLPLFSCKVNKEFIIEGKFIEAKEVKFSPFACILSQSKEGYRD